MIFQKIVLNQNDFYSNSFYRRTDFWILLKNVLL